MGLIARLEAKLDSDRKTIGDTAAIRNLLSGYQVSSKSGMAVNWQTALQVTTALACARVIAEGLAQVPYKLYRDAGGIKSVARDHPLYRLLASKPNDLQTSFEFRETLALHLVFCGNAYVWLNRLRGVIVEMLIYLPQQVTVKQVNWENIYTVRVGNGEQIQIPADQMWHLRGPSWDGVLGLDAIKQGREVLGLALATEEHSSRMFSNGARVGGLLSTDTTLKADQVKDLRDSWEQTQGGVANAFKTAILWGGLKYSPMSQTNEQAQMVELRRFQVAEVCRHFRVMPIMIGFDDKNATFASAEQMFLAHVVHTLGPWYARIEQSADAALLTKKEIADGYYTHFVTAGLLRGAHKDRAEYYAKALGSGGSPAWMTQDEVRELDELNPMGGDASKLPKPTNVGTKAPPTDPAPSGD